MQFICGVGAYRLVAWRGMELRALGHCFLCADFSGEKDLRQAAGTKSRAGTYLHSASDSRDMGDIRDYGHGTAGGISGQSCRVS